MSRNKYHAKKATQDGITFASQKERNRYCELKLLERAGRIRNLELQPKFYFDINGIRCGFYKADFVYFEGEKRVVEDVKGFKTPLYKFKKRIVAALYNVEILET